jgi:hypothetical protein
MVPHFAFPPPGKSPSMNPVKNVLAAHCRQDRGGQTIDIGLVVVDPE